MNDDSGNDVVTADGQGAAVAGRSIILGVAHERALSDAYRNALRHNSAGEESHGR